MMTRNLGALALAASLVGSFSWSPPKLLDGPIPAPFATGDGAYVAYEVRVSRDGSTSEVTVLGARDSFGSRFREAIASWRFEPTEAEASVLVVGLSRSPTLPSAFGPWPRTPHWARASGEIPLPTRIVLPPFPPQATFEGIVLLEVEVDEGGEITEIKVVDASDRFDEVCRDTLMRWEFEPARQGGDPVATRAYVLCNFRTPPKAF